jgi:hypothetical protein
MPAVSDLRKIAMAAERIANQRRRIQAHKARAKKEESDRRQKEQEIQAAADLEVNQRFVLTRFILQNQTDLCSADIRSCLFKYIRTLPDNEVDILQQNFKYVNRLKGFVWDPLTEDPLTTPIHARTLVNAKIRMLESPEWFLGENGR